MAIRHGIMASSFSAMPPSATISSTTNYNQELATFNATVSANGSSTTVYFDYSTSSSFTTYSTVTVASPVTTDNASVYYNASGLTANTLYYVRVRAVSSGGTTTSSSTSFTTWALQVYERSTSGGTTFTIPTVTPTGGSAVTVSIYDIIMFGGGGGGGSDAKGAGGGGYISQASQSLTGNRSITTSVGAGGSAGASPPNATNGTSGTSSTISGDITTLTAAGGGNDASGTSGNGNTAGAQAEFNAVNDGKNFTTIAYGGGGGAGSNGYQGTQNGSTVTGGKGGDGVSITRGGVTRAGGAGGGGDCFTLEGATLVRGSTGIYNSYGSGGSSCFNSVNSPAPTAGQAGLIRFRYYASSALA